MQGWKTKWGAAIAFAGVVAEVGSQACPVEEARPWFHFIALILGGGGGALATAGVAHKIEKAGKAFMGEG
jgi:hypothetical protein